MPDPRETAPNERIVFTAEADADHIEKNLRLTEEQLKQPKTPPYIYPQSPPYMTPKPSQTATGDACTVTVRVRLLTLLPQISV